MKNGGLKYYQSCVFLVILYWEWRRKMIEKNENISETVHEMNSETLQESGQQTIPRPRAVPNILRREPDSRPEHPENSKPSGSSFVLLLVLAVILFLVFAFWLKK